MDHPTVVLAIILSVLATATATENVTLAQPTPTTGDGDPKATHATSLPVRSSNDSTPVPDAADDDALADVCRLTTVDPNQHLIVAQVLKDKATLIEYHLRITNYTDAEQPLGLTVAGAYDARKWDRVTTSHGQTLLSLAFNYGILSMMTLTLGTEVMKVDLVENPPKCMSAIDDRKKLAAVRRLLMRDFEADGEVKTVGDHRICNEVILDDGSGYGHFRHECWFQDAINKRITSVTEIGNFWLSLLHAMLLIVRMGLLIFGPVLFISAIESMSKLTIPYVVKLKEKLFKTVVFADAETSAKSLDGFRFRRTLDLRSMKAFQKLRNASRDVARGVPLRVCFSQYDISVDYKRTLKENTVPVGLFQTLFSTLFKCQIRHVGPFVDCCRREVFTSPCGGGADANATDSSGRFDDRKPPCRGFTWIKMFRKLSRLLIIVLVPLPFYIRLAIFYAYEYDEVQRRKDALAALGLREQFENSVMHYFTPTHGVFVFIYVVYGLTAFALAFLSVGQRDHRMKKIIVESFRDLKRLDWTDTLNMFVANVIWPFKRFGAFGCVVGIVYYPIVLPISVFVGVSYFLPTLYLTIRMALHSRLAVLVKGRRSKRKTYKIRVDVDRDMYRFETENILKHNETIGRTESSPSLIALDDVDYVKPAEHMKDISDRVSLASSIISYPTFSWRRFVKYTVCAILCILTLYAVVFVLSEVIGCFVEIVVFTIMGVIVNAASLLKYVMLFLMIFVYCCDCFNNMAKKYLKMNKALFGEVKFRIKDLEKVTSLPSTLQENRGFKSQELNEQADYESPDDIARKPPRHWMINDLVLFVDSEDMPRIPRQLFDEVCQIRVAGVPGPVFRGHLEALAALLKIIIFLLFVFVIVLSFGAVYKVSATNQMLATLLGGFLPMVLRSFLAPPAPDVELGTVSFKSKMDEVIKNFCQYWPIYDLPFEMAPPEEVKDEAAAGGDGKKDDPAAAAKTDAGKVDASASPGSNNNNSVVAVGGGDGSDDKRASTATGPKSPLLKKGVTIDMGESTPEIDILILLPQIDLQWLDEWSDLGSRADMRTVDDKHGYSETAT